MKITISRLEQIILEEPVKPTEEKD